MGHVLADSLTASDRQVSQTDIMTSTLLQAGFLLITRLLCPTAVTGEELPLTENVPISEFQNRTEDTKAYDFDAPPQGLFRTITMAEDVEERLGVQRTHEIVPVTPTERFTSTQSPIFVVFSVHQHYQGFTVFGRCSPEEVPGIAPHTIVSEDAMHLALEDDNGYLRLLPPSGGWKPGRYIVAIHAGEQINEMSLMGTMRFTIVAPTP